MSLSMFGQWLAQTREAIMTSPDKIVNDVTKNSYLLDRAIDKQNPFKNIRGGQRIVDKVKLVDSGTMAAYLPGQPRSVGRVNTTRTVSYEWAFTESHVTYSDAEIILNQSGDRYTYFKDLRKSFRQDGVTDHVNGLDSMLGAQANYTSMVNTGGTTARVPHSISAFITEDVVARVAPGWGSGNPIGGLDPLASGNSGFTATVTNSSSCFGVKATGWMNQVSKYDHTASTNANSGIIAAFDDMSTKVMFTQPRKLDASVAQASKLSDFVILTNTDGINRYRQLLRAANQRYVNDNNLDPAYNMPQFTGMDIQVVDVFDTTALTPTGGDGSTAYTGYSSNVWASGKPRYLFWNTQYLFPVFHPERFMYESDPVSGGITASDVEAIFYRSWLAFCCNSRRRQGIVAPIVA